MECIYAALEKMGCVSSRPDINDLHANIFEVMNVDELGQRVSPGTIELTEAEIVLYQGDSTITRWPLRCLRRYGFDAEIFSFESGRRCPSGAGIYAFRCRRAEQLFNLVQHNIQQRNLSDELIMPVPPAVTAGDFAPTGRLSSLPTSGSTTTASVTSDPLPQRPPSTRLSRPGSLTSNGPLSPTALVGQPQEAAEHNNNKRNANSSTATSQTNSLQHSYSNATSVDLPATPSDCCHVYMNVTPGAEEQSPLMQQQQPPEEEPRHCYANLEIETLRPPSPTQPLRKVNYIELDLDETPQLANPPAPPPDSPKRTPPNESYATIDFNRTNALSQSANPTLDNEGSRKTRHNSTIGELNTRHSNSLSD